MTLQEIKDAVTEGKTVCWAQDNYIVENWKNGLHIVCQNNKNAIGLTHKDGITMNGNEEDFYIKGEKTKMKKIIVEEKVEIWIKRVRLVPENLTNEEIKEIMTSDDLDDKECEDITVLFETEELMPVSKNNGYHTVKVLDESGNTIFVNGKE